MGPRNGEIACQQDQTGAEAAEQVTQRRLGDPDDDVVGPPLPHR